MNNNPVRAFKLAHPLARQRALQTVSQAPDGWIVIVREPTRSLNQNALMWVYLQCFSRQLMWPVNGVMCALTPAEWKDILSAAFSQEQQRVAPGLSGGMVLLGQRTRNYGVKRFGEFITFIQAVAADRGVHLGDEPPPDIGSSCAAETDE